MYAGTQMPGPMAPIRVSVCGEREGGEGWEGERGCDLLKDGRGDARANGPDSHRDEIPVFRVDKFGYYTLLIENG